MIMASGLIILGLGNILCADDGFGVRLLEYLYEKWDFPPEVKLIDGGSQGQALYCYVEEAQKMLVLDAVDFGCPPGELVVKNCEEIPQWLGARKMSAHQASFQETLALAALKGVSPTEIKLVGLQPRTVEFGEPPIAFTPEKLAEASTICLELLSCWDIFPQAASLPKPALNSALI